MKKLFVLIAVVIASASVASAQKWSAGARVGTGFQGVAQYHVSDKNYVEVRLGMDYVSGLNAEFSALYNWRVAQFDWTSSGDWFFDAGAGLFVGGQAHLARIGVQGVAKLGYTFENIPLSLAFDFSPSFGPAIGYVKKQTVSGLGIIPDFTFGGTSATFDDMAICNLGISCVYNF